MSIFHKIVSASLSPNAEGDDVLLAVKLLFRPWEWLRGSGVKRVEEWFGKNFREYRAISFNSGRSALFGILKSFDLKKGDEVLVQAFTCVAVPNSVLWTGAEPIYVDIDRSLNIDLLDAQKKVTSKTRAILIQHTLGILADMDNVLAFAKKNNILVIEDCAHSLGATCRGKKIGSFGDAAFFSFGRDKVISSIFGGVAMVHRRHETQCMKLKDFHKKCSLPDIFWVFQQLLHPVLFSIILPTYRVGIGKVILFFSQRLKLLSIPVYPEEKKGKKPHDFPAKYPNALALLLLLQLKKLERYNTRRGNTALYYMDHLKDTATIELLSYPPGSLFLRFPVLVSSPSDVIKNAKKRGVLLGNWYHNVIDPSGVDFRAIGYVAGSCPVAENIAKRVINLPTNNGKGEADRVVGCMV